MRDPVEEAGESFGAGVEHEDVVAVELVGIEPVGGLGARWSVAASNAAP